MSKEAQAFRDQFVRQVPTNCCNLALGSRTAPLRAIVTVFYPSYRQDLDCALIYDLLQEFRVVSNDRWIREKHEFAEVDPKNARVEVTIEEV